MLFLLFLILPSAYSMNCTENFDGMNYTKMAILTIRGLPTNLVYNPINKDLHFTLIDIESLQDDHVQTKMDQYILRENEPIKIDNINGQAAAIDMETQRVYIATDDGLYFLNNSDQPQFLSNKDEDIVHIFKTNKTDELYAITFPDNEVYIIDAQTKEKLRVEKVPCAYLLAVDNEENVFYECDSKYIKVLLKGFQEPIEFVGIPKNSARAITIDSFNRVILAANDGLYLLKSSNIIPAKLMDLDFPPDRKSVV